MVPWSEVVWMILIGACVGFWLGYAVALRD